jgi:hypothetical protein
LIELAPRLFEWATVAVNGFIALADGIENLQDIWNASFLGKGTAEALPTTEAGIKKRLRDLDKLNKAIVNVEAAGLGSKAFNAATQFSGLDLLTTNSFETKDKLGTNIFGEDLFDAIKNDVGEATRAISAQRKQLLARQDGRVRETESIDSRLLDPTTQKGIDDRLFDLDDLKQNFDGSAYFERIGFDLFGKEAFEQLNKNSEKFEEAIKVEIERISKLDLSKTSPVTTFPSGQIDQSIITRDPVEKQPVDLGEEFHAVMEEVARDLDLVNSLVETGKTPLDNYRAELDKLARIQSSDGLRVFAGGDETFSRARVQAVEELASATDDYQAAIDELVKLSATGLISADEFGQGFQNLTDNVETAGVAIQRLDGLGLSPEAYIAAANAIKASVDYEKDLTAEKQKQIEANVKLVEGEIAVKESALELAQLRGDLYGEEGVEILQRELDILREQIALQKTGIDPQTAEGQAKKIIETEELATLQGQMRDAFKGAFRAALDGDFEGFLANKLKNAASQMFDRALDSLFDALFEGLKGFGGKGGLNLGAIGKFFAGFFADGGVIGTGKFGLVGENGPELVSAGSGPIRITPLDSGLTERYKGISTRGLESRGSNQQPASNITMNIAGVKDLSSFVKSQGTIEADMAAAMRRAQADF